MSSRKSRHKLMQVLVKGSLGYLTNPEYARIEVELEELGNCARIQPVKRQRLLQVIHASRSIDSCLSLILKDNGISPEHGIGQKLHQLKRLNPATRGYVDHATAVAFSTSIARKRNLYAHSAARFPTSTNEVEAFVSEVHACLALIL